MEDLIGATKRRSFHPQKKLTTWFVGEEGRDTGGLTRELWRLFGRDVQGLCDGSPKNKIIRHDAAKFRVCYG